MFMTNVKILILSMSCNQTYFKALLGVVKDTWAKPLIHNKYENINWFGYTSCDEKHPEPCVDFEEHMIYVDCEDSLQYSYDKTKKAYEMIKQYVDFDYVVRTNTSVFVNVKNLVKRVNDVYDKKQCIIGRTYKLWMTDEMWLPLTVGFLFGMRKEMFDIATESDHTELYNYVENKYEVNDDIIMSYNLTKYFGVQQKNYLAVHQDGNVYMYKSFKEEDEDNFPQIKTLMGYKYTNDPFMINNLVFLRLRTCYQDIERSEKGHELEHFYEVNDVLE